jgi:nucleotide-binding universal stress UspA family protein
MTAPIIVGTDGSEPSLTAVQWGAAEATRRGASLRIVHVLEYRPGPVPAHTHLPGHELAGLFRHDLPHHARAALARACHLAAETAPGLDVRTAAVFGNAAEVLAAISATAVLLVVGCPGTGESPGLRPGSVALCLASRARCPVVFAAAGSRPVLDEIVVGADGSDDARAALEFGFGEADIRNARLTALHAWAHPGARWPENDGAWLLSVGEPNNDAVAMLREHLAPWRQNYPDVPVTESVVHGHPGRALTLASSSADLVVVGGHRDQWAQAPDPDPVGYLLHHAHCPVVLVPDERWRPRGGRSAA